MDAQTADAVDTLRADIRHVETSLTADIHRVETSLSADIRQVETSLTGEIHRVRVEIHELNSDTKRHVDVVTESLRDDIRIVAEGVVALTAKVDSLRR
jgi:hypothetical protein